MLSRRSVLPLVLALAVVGGCAKSAQQYFDSGNRYFAEGKYKEARVEFLNAVQKDPRFGDAHFKLADTFARLGDGPNALREYVNAADLLPGNKDAQLKAGSFLMFARRYEDARTRAEKVLKMDPNNLDARLLRSKATFGLKEVDDAIRQVEEAIQLDPKAASAYMLLGLMQNERGDAAAAETALRQGVELDPKSVIGHVNLGQFLAGHGRQVEAEASFKAAYALDPKNATAARSLAAFYMASNRGGEAEPYLKTLADNSQDLAPTLDLAGYYVSMRRPDDAVALLTKAAARKDGGAEASVRLAAIEYGQGKTAQAHKIIDDLLARDAKNSRALIVKAQFLFQEKKLDAALARAKAAVAAAPRSVPAQYLLGTVYAAKKQPDEAIAAFTEVLRLNPRDVAAQVQLAQLQMMNGERESALQSAQAASVVDPNNPIVRLLLARALIANGDVTRAEAELKGLEAQFPKAPDVQSAMGSMLLAKHDLVGARQAFDKTLALDPNSNEALTGLVTLDAAAKKLPEAKARVEARLARTPNDPAVLILAARTYSTLGDFAKFEQTLLKTLEVAPDTLEAYGLLGNLYMAQKRLDEARQMFAGMAAHQSKPVGAETMIAMLLQVQGKTAEARKQYEKVLTIDPRAAVAANNLAWMYVESGDNLDVALQLAQTAKAQLPNQPEVNDTLGWIFYKKGLTSLALAPLSLAVDQDKDPTNPKYKKNAVYQFHLGMALAKNGEDAKARTALQTALALDANFAGAADARKTLAALK
jgi:tetratricopeptide (TPR) repeat protein